MTSVTPAMRPIDGKVSRACKAGTGTAGKLAPQCRHRTHGVQKNIIKIKMGNKCFFLDMKLNFDLSWSD